MRISTVAIAVALGLFGAGGVSQAQPDDLAGWQAARWGMDAAELETAFGTSLATLPGVWDFGPLYATQALFDARFAGLGFTAFLQMDRADDVLQQVLLERRDIAVTPEAYLQLLDGLEAAFGPPDYLCSVYPEGRSPTIIQARWTFPTTTVHASLLDFVTTAIAFHGTSGFNALIPSRDTRVINRRSLPRRILLRLHPTDRIDLLPRRDCP